MRNCVNEKSLIHCTTLSGLDTSIVGLGYPAEISCFADGQVIMLLRDKQWKLSVFIQIHYFKIRDIYTVPNFLL